MFTKRFIVGVGSALTVAVLSAGLVNGICAQDGGKAAVKVEKKEGEKKEKAEARLPSNYGKLELTADQRKKVLEIQAKYDSQLDDLEKKIADLKAKRSSECEAVLTGPQKASLQELNDESKKKSAASKKKGTEKGEKSEAPKEEK